MTGPEGEARSVWKAPPPEALPGPEATLEEIVRFARSADPTEHFGAQGGDQDKKKAGVVAGSYVTEGVVDRRHLVKVIRDGVIVREGARVASLRRFKDDVKEVRAGFECGIRLEDFDDIHLGDHIEAYEIVKTARTL